MRISTQQELEDLLTSLPHVKSWRHERPINRPVPSVDIYIRLDFWYGLFFIKAFRKHLENLFRHYSDSGIRWNVYIKS